jgi:uncharacterized iron-regulated membrane protein
MLDRVGEWYEDHPVAATLCGIGLIAAALTGLVGLIVAIVPEDKPGVVKARTEAAAIEWAKGIGYEDPKVVCDDETMFDGGTRNVRCTLATEHGGRLQALRCSAYTGQSAACRLEVAP